MEEKTGFDSKKEYVEWVRRLGYEGKSPKEATEFLMARGLCPIIDQGRIYVESWG